MPNRLFTQNPVVLNNASGNLELVPKQQLDSGLAGKSDTTHTHVRAYAAKTGSYTLTTTDSIVVFNTASGAMNATLPTAVGATGKTYVIKKLGGSTANPLTILTTSSQTIDGATSEPISIAGGFREVVSDGANWQIIGGRVEPVIITLSNLTTAGQNISIDASVGSIYRIAATSSASTCTLAVPTNPIDGDAINVEVTATVATVVTINASILLTTGITSPISVPIGKKLFLGLRTISTTWYLLAAQVQS